MYKEIPYRGSRFIYRDRLLWCGFTPVYVDTVSEDSIKVIKKEVKIHRRAVTFGSHYLEAKKLSYN